MLQIDDLRLSFQVFPMHLLSALNLDMRLIALHLPLVLLSLLVDLSLEHQVFSLKVLALLLGLVQLEFITSEVLHFVLELLVDPPQFFNLRLQLAVLFRLALNFVSDGFLHAFQLLLFDGLLLLVAQDQLFVLLVLSLGLPEFLHFLIVFF